MHYILTTTRNCPTITTILLHGVHVLIVSSVIFSEVPFLQGFRTINQLNLWVFSELQIKLILI